MPGLKPYEHRMRVEFFSEKGAARMVITVEPHSTPEWRQRAAMGMESQLTKVPGVLAARASRTPAVTRDQGVVRGLAGAAAVPSTQTGPAGRPAYLGNRCMNGSASLKARAYEGRCISRSRYAIDTGWVSRSGP